MPNLKIMNRAIILLISILMMGQLNAQDKIQNINFLFANNGYGFGYGAITAKKNSSDGSWVTSFPSGISSAHWSYYVEYEDE